MSDDDDVAAAHCSTEGAKGHFFLIFAAFSLLHYLLPVLPDTEQCQLAEAERERKRRNLVAPKSLITWLAG